MGDLYELRCDRPWHTDPRYDDGGEPHYIECMKPVEPVGTLTVKASAYLHTYVTANGRLKALPPGRYTLVAEEADNDTT